MMPAKLSGKMYILPFFSLYFFRKIRVRSVFNIRKISLVKFWNKIIIKQYNAKKTQNNIIYEHIFL